MNEALPKPWPGVRRARICTVCSRREFLKPEQKWSCPEHGASKTIDQPNAPYFKQSTV